MLIQADSRVLPFPDHTFDVCFGAPPWDEPNLLGEARPEMERVLKRKGRFILVLPHAEDRHAATLALANRDWSERQTFKCEKPTLRIGPRYFSPRDEFVQSVLRQFGPPKGSLILDPFCGTGTVVRVATKLGYAAVGCDIDREALAA